VGGELLFDYNDSQSTMSFLNLCPVCGAGGKRRRLADGDPTQRSNKRQLLDADGQQSTDDIKQSTDDGEQATAVAATSSNRQQPVNM